MGYKVDLVEKSKI